jgi:PAS domain S-box-containing protein
MAPRTVQVPERFEELFLQAEARLSEWLAQRTQQPDLARIEVGNERYLEVRASSLSVEFFDLVREHYGGDRTPEADSVARSLLYDIASALARVDAARMAEQLGVDDAELKLALGPVHFAITGWARVELHEGSSPVRSEDFALLYDHHHSFESEAWLSSGRTSDEPVCVMNAGYSSGWCSSAYGLDLVATEVLCRGRGDPCCRFIMAPPHRLAEYVAEARRRWPEHADRIRDPHVPGYLTPKSTHGRALFDNSSRFRIAFEHAQTGMAIVSTEGRYVLCNPAYGEMFKSDAEAMVGQFVGHLSPDDVRRQTEELFRSALRGERDRFRRELQLRDAEGETIHADVAGSLIRDETGRGLFFVLQMQDLTAQRHAQEQLQRAQKMQVAQELAGGLAHDLNNLLTIILGAADQLEIVLGDAHRGAAAVDAIQRAASRAGTVTQQLLSFSRRQVVEARVHNLGEIIRELSVLLERVLGERIELAVTLDPDVPAVRIDAGQLEQVLVNLTVNARHAMPVGGRLEIDLRKEGLDAVIDVRDNGVGMPPEVLAQALEPFFTTRPEGTGLGLAVVHGIVQQAGGELQVHSVEDEGTHIEVRLPGVDDTPVSIPPRHGLSSAGGHEVVLLAEDDDEIRHMLIEALDALGYATLAAADGEEAVALAIDAPQIDLLLTDVVMPGLAGPEVADHIAGRHRKVKVLFMSGYADAELEHHSLPDDARVLRKPFTLKAMASRVREILDG